MIPARVLPWFRAWFARDAEKRIVATFGRIYIAGLDRLRTALAHGPVLVVSNHTSFWDPLCVLFLTRRVLRAEARALMDAKNLTRLPFFALVGAFGIHRDDPRDALAAIRYAVRSLVRPNDLVWVFPQGKEVPLTRPLAFEGGASHIERLAKGATVVAIALRYEFGEGEKPCLWISIGPARPTGRDVEESRKAQEDAVSAQLANIERALGASGDGFDTYFEARAGFFLRFGSRVLSWFARTRGALHTGSPVRK